MGLLERLPSLRKSNEYEDIQGENIGVGGQPNPGFLIQEGSSPVIFVSKNPSGPVTNTPGGQIKLVEIDGEVFVAERGSKRTRATEGQPVISSAGDILQRYGTSIVFVPDFKPDRLRD